MTQKQDYYSIKDRVSNSSLSYLKQSPMHFKAFLDGDLDKDTNPMNFGRYLHEKVLEPHKVDKRWAVKQDGRTKVGKAANTEALEAGLQLISQDEADKAKDMAESLNKCDTLDYHLNFFRKNTLLEHEIFFEMEGVPCKSKLDMVVKGKFVLDLKTAVSAKPEEFKRKATFAYDYDRQAAFYKAAAEAAGLWEEGMKFYFLAVEKEPPYAWSLIEVDDTILKRGERKYKELLELYKECKAKNEWPGYGASLWEDETEREMTFEATPVSAADISMSEMMQMLGMPQKSNNVAYTKPRYRLSKKMGEWVATHIN
ncbi:PD-(D/E)XK nuclease-like domain-containing protein [Limibacter armeniacum]|uniref:PD-(D/E)XK nuclease-like domain-containing protein n=1 Tax=Limibacter armeniacum TaxID=466084 RepID=UPI002FE559EA